MKRFALTAAFPFLLLLLVPATLRGSEMTSALYSVELSSVTAGGGRSDTGVSGCTLWSAIGMPVASGKGDASADSQLFAGVYTASPDKLWPFIDITNVNSLLAYEIASFTVSGTNEPAVNSTNIIVGLMWWTNALNGANGTLAPTASWSIAGVALAIGSNVITVCGSNALGNTAADSLALVRLPAGSGIPFIDVTNTEALVMNVVTSWSVGGTNNDHVIGMMRWTNTLTGGQGSLAAASGWIIPNIALGVGSNMITVAGTNLYGTATNDSVRIIRRAASSASNVRIGLSSDYAHVILTWDGFATIWTNVERYYTPFTNANPWAVAATWITTSWVCNASGTSSLYIHVQSDGGADSVYDVGKFDVHISSGSIAWISFPFVPQDSCDTLGEWFGQQLEARLYNSYAYAMLQVQNGLGGSVITRSYYVDNLGGGTTNWFPSDDAIVQNAGYVLFLAQDHPAVKLTSLGMVPTNDVTLQLPYQTLPWIGLSYPSIVDMRSSGVTNLFTPPKNYSTFDYDFIDAQEILGGPVWYAEYFIDDWGGGTTNFFPSLAGGDKFDAGKGCLMFFSTARNGSNTWWFRKPY